MGFIESMYNPLCLEHNLVGQALVGNPLCLGHDFVVAIPED